MKEDTLHSGAVRYLQRGQIDDERWNRVVASSRFETVYGQSWYLDASADHWGAFILHDYAYVMPVAFRIKLGFRYLYQPRFCQQLGVYSANKVDDQITSMFLGAMSKKFRLGDYAFNEGNRVVGQKGFEISDSTNFTLQLNAPYEELTQAYTSNCRRNIRKADQASFVFYEDISIRELVLLKRQYDHARKGDGHYQSLTDMFSGMQAEGDVRAYGVKVGQDLCAGAIFATCGKRMHYLLAVATEEGKALSGMFYLIDRLIQMRSGKNLYLDFEGSNIPSVARFFSGFGAEPQIYQRIRFNNAAGKLVQKIRSVRSG
jgi:hypothetical protein